MFLALFVTAVELGQVRGRVQKLETNGAPAPAAGTPVTLKVTNHGAVVHNLSMDGGPKTPDLKPHQTATLTLGAVAKAMPGACSIPATRKPA